MYAWDSNVRPRKVVTDESETDVFKVLPEV